jgi:hypothetical protein
LASILTVFCYQNCQNLQYLSLSGCQNVIDATQFNSIYHLDLSHCSNLENIDALGGPSFNKAADTKGAKLSSFNRCNQIINLSYCKKLTSVNHLSTLQELNITGCLLISDISELNHIPKLIVAKCTGIQSFEHLGDSSNQRYVDVSGTMISDEEIFQIYRNMSTRGSGSDCYREWDSSGDAKNEEKKAYSNEIEVRYIICKGCQRVSDECFREVLLDSQLSWGKQHQQHLQQEHFKTSTDTAAKLPLEVCTIIPKVIIEVDEDITEVCLRNKNNLDDQQIQSLDISSISTLHATF